MRCLVTSVSYRIHEEGQAADDELPGSSAYIAYDLARVRTLLEEQGHEVIALDGSNQDRAALTQLLTGFAPEVIIVDASSFQDHGERHLLSELFLLAKTVLPQIKTVWGGRDAANLLDFALLHNLVTDAVLCDESDSVLPTLLAHWSEQEQGPASPPATVAGVAYRSGENIVKTPSLPQNKLATLDDLPFLDYREIHIKEGEAPIIMSSRGCPFGCRFCYRQYRSYRAHSVDYFIDHLHHLYRTFGFRDFRIDDELFTLDRDRCLAICSALTRLALPIEFDCYSRANTFDVELAQALKQAGCHTVWFGAESGSDELLQKMDKAQTREQTARAIEAAHAAGLKVCCNILVGYPGENPDTLIETYKMLAELKPDKLSTQRLRAMPGTRLYQECVSQGVLDEQAWVTADKDFTYEKEFSREGLEVQKNLLRQFTGDRNIAIDDDIAAYLAFKSDRPVCLCRSITENELRVAAASGADTLKKIKQQTGAMGGCGGCANIIATLMKVWSHENSNETTPA